MIERLAGLEYGVKIVFSEIEDSANFVRRSVTLPGATIFCHKYRASHCKSFDWLEPWWCDLVREAPDVHTLVSSLVFLHPRPPIVFEHYPVLCHDVSSWWKQVIVDGRAYLVLSWMPVRSRSSDFLDIVIFEVGEIEDIYNQAVDFFSAVELGRVCLGYYNDELRVVSTPKCMDTFIASDAIGIHLGGGVYLYGDVIIDLNIAESVCCVHRDIINKPVVFTSSQYILGRARETIINHWNYLNR